MTVARGWEKREVGSCLLGMKLQFLQNEKVLEVTCTTM